MRLGDIQIRDPFVLTDHGRYWLFGSTDANIWDGPATGFDTYWSVDLEEWHGPVPAFRPRAEFWSHTQYWAPEVHRHHDAYYMFATFTAAGHRRGTQVLRADRPEGPYEPWSDGPLTPRDWECLDGTLHIEDGTPYLVFCREWKDVGDGEVHAMRLTDDLRSPAESPHLLFRASEAPWAREIARPEFPRVLVTDGPSMHRTRDDRLLMLWSSFGESGYAMGQAFSESGSILGPWTQSEQPVWPADGGHGMIFADAAGELFLTLHTPNRTPDERARFFPLEETAHGLRLRT
ncbi:glycoside hydrolase family 43 protein [Microbacterium sp. MAHUQ-60]|uniref:glycoside hydrolase family 43 protein n=1 Tax=unclassified Microbacterium TaxID=2609290 RepID=UPI0036153DCB